MMQPTICTGGTSRDQLLEEARRASNAVENAIVNVGKITVHKRDFHLQGPDAIGRACDEYNILIGKLYSVRNEILQYENGLHNGGDGVE